MVWKKESEQELMDVDLHNEITIGEFYHAKTCVNYELTRIAYENGRVSDIDWEQLTLTIGQPWGDHTEVYFTLEELEAFAEFVDKFAKQGRHFKELYEATKPSNWEQL